MLDRQPPQHAMPQLPRFLAASIAVLQRLPWRADQPHTGLLSAVIEPLRGVTAPVKHAALAPPQAKGSGIATGLAQGALAAAGATPPPEVAATGPPTQAEVLYPASSSCCASDLVCLLLRVSLGYAAQLQVQLFHTHMHPEPQLH
jgi:hypothetical protein